MFRGIIPIDSPLPRQVLLITTSDNIYKTNINVPLLVTIPSVIRRSHFEYVIPNMALPLSILTFELMPHLSIEDELILYVVVEMV